MAPPTSSRVRKANKATANKLSSTIAGVLEELRYSAQVVTSSELSDMDKESIWDLFEQNMRHMYGKSSMGWDPQSKMEELFHRDSRFVIIRQRRQAQDRPDADLPFADGIPVMAYSMFRFDVEDDECVLYCYELQVSRSVQRGGIGKALMKCLYEIARGWKMQKVMLTVFKENHAAFLFYKAMGFNVQSDEEWADEDEDVDYWIMSKDVTM